MVLLHKMRMRCVMFYAYNNLRNHTPLTFISLILMQAMNNFPNSNFYFSASYHKEEFQEISYNKHIAGP